MEKYYPIDEEIVTLANGKIKKVRSILAPIITIICIILGVLIILFGQQWANKFGFRLKPILIYGGGGILIVGSLLWLWVSSHYFLHVSSKSKLVEWYRYYDNSEKKALKELFAENEFDKMPDLLFAHEKDGPGSGRSAIRLEFKGTKTGEVVFAQIIQFIRSNPTPVTPVKMFEGDDAKLVVKIAKKIDQ